MTTSADTPSAMNSHTKAVLTSATAAHRGSARHFHSATRPSRSLRELGLEVERYSEFVDRNILAGLTRAVFFDRETFGVDRLVVGEGDLPWEEFFARTPFSPDARADLIRIHTQTKDYMAGLSAAEKRARLAKMSYQDYLVNVANVSPEAIKYFLGQGGRNNKRVDTLPALEAAEQRMASSWISSRAGVVAPNTAFTIPTATRQWPDS